MKGTRVDAQQDDADQWPFPRLKSGEYGKDTDGIWYCIPPGTKLLGCLANHTIQEHDDGTITVSPSILVRGHDGEYHGYLEKGIWREC